MNLFVVRRLLGSGAHGIVRIAQHVQTLECALPSALERAVPRRSGHQTAASAAQRTFLRQADAAADAAEGSTRGPRRSRHAEAVVPPHCHRERRFPQVPHYPCDRCCGGTAT